MKAFGCCLIQIRQYKLWRLYDTGMDKIEKDLDIIKIVKAIRNLKIFYKSRVSKADRVLVKNHGDNVIDIDTPSESEEKTNSNTQVTFRDIS